jgi:hypothetical protein
MARSTSDLRKFKSNDALAPSSSGANHLGSAPTLHSPRASEDAKASSNGEPAGSADNSNPKAARRPIIRPAAGSPLAQSDTNRPAAGSDGDMAPKRVGWKPTAAPIVSDRPVVSCFFFFFVLLFVVEEDE